MKKLFILGLVFMMLLTFVSCNTPADTTVGSQDNDTSGNNENEQTPAGECEHVMSEATCTSPPYCTKCGRPIGSRLGHDWGAGAVCTRCGKEDPLSKKGEGITRVVCVGDSITQYNPYWANNMLGKLDSTYEVIGLGVSGSTGLASGIDGGEARGYVIHEEYKTSLRYNPDIVVIMLGTNDSKPINSDRIEADGGEQFKKDMIAMVESYQNLPAEAEVYIALPPTRHPSDKYFQGINDEDIVNLIIPLLLEVAEVTGASVIDVHTATKDAAAYFTDGVHPSGEEGRDLIATAIADKINADHTPRE